MGVTFEFEMGQEVQHVEYVGYQGKVVELMVDRDSVKWAGVQRLNTDGQLTVQWVREEDLKLVK